MSNKNSTAIYRTLLREAWRLTWQRKTLWIFGIFAAFVSTGGVMDVATTGIRRVQVGGSLLQQLFDSSFSGYTQMGKYIAQMQMFGSFQISIMIIFMTLIMIGLLFLAVLSQTSLVHGIKASTHEHPNIIRKRAHDHLFRIFTIDVLTKVSGAVLICITTLPMLWYYAEFTTYSFSIAFIQILIFFPAVLILSILSILSVIHVIETESTVVEAITTAWQIFKTHWLATLEYAFILFCLISISCFILLGIIIFLSVPYAIVYTASLLTGSFVIFVVANALYGLFALAVVFAFGGGIVTFQYSAWYLFYKRTEHRSHPKLPIAKILRFFTRT
ncbi:hypothetical protein A2318_04135 [Candidatus Uhrbacteria bacterium RIFOXYB2_FULL_45_11]|uniref:Glycerophosphoryl diester phosphodiesterase membrane domain-containing protein n=1 Tax=Candidatus Uhrbacteria bacterium RIFOXYB2_FULL_45_11 TaxID=1802421 RepID=A0A1F7W341_9BACT|nr:MAG: hypothetical protein A2318_04135 [Candidatus Uhrbacteria bacterium RIFOXYB2_FULL_45_11]